MQVTQHNLITAKEVGNLKVARLFNIGESNIRSEMANLQYVNSLWVYIHIIHF